MHNLKYDSPFVGPDIVDGVREWRMMVCGECASQSDGSPPFKL